MAEAQFARIDATPPNPENGEEAYFFTGTRYVLVNVTENSIVNEPKDIATEWPALHDAGFETVDAMFPLKFSNETYVFSEKQYLLLNVRPGTTNDSIIFNPKTLDDEWPSLRGAVVNANVVEGERGKG